MEPIRRIQEVIQTQEKHWRDQLGLQENEQTDDIRLVTLENIRIDIVGAAFLFASTFQMTTEENFKKFQEFIDNSEISQPKSQEIMNNYL